VRGDVTVPETLDAAMAGQAAVLNAVGPSKGGPEGLRTTAAQNLVAAMQRNGVSRIVQLSTFGTGDSKGKGGFVFDNIIAPFVMKKTLVDQEGAEAAVHSAESIDWVMVRPARLTNGPRSERAKAVFDGGKASWKASRSDVAAFMVAQLDDDTYLGQAPGLVA
jgi:uncharacterized protein YbjT (DUF2867 family)